ncbi:MAG: hypothetical protein IH977_03570 [Nitrospinae bacterium]|nr:hypothetical protein [Nitrospinota bacterium]
MAWRRVVHGLLAFSFCVSMIPAVRAAEVTIRHHTLEVDIHPEQHEIFAQDTIRLEGHVSSGSSLHVLLNPALTLDQVLWGSRPLSFREPQRVPPMRKAESLKGRPPRIIEITLPEGMKQPEAVELTMVYHGQINEPPRPTPGLRFVRPDKTNGHIGPEGVYLTAETFWYPDIPGSLATYHVRVRVPEGWEAVTHGREVGRMSEAGKTRTEWAVEAKTEALTLVANRFVKKQRDWEGIEIASFLFPEDAHLADQYLDATVEYLKVYTKLLGPYPFPKFAVVENFFPSGIGLPSFTLLGSRIIKRGYTQPYSLGHEIVHSWFGNSVLNDVDQGNWVEGLTTYLANYYYEELFGGGGKARAERRRMVFEYSLYAPPEKDYALVEFHHKESRLDNAVGYQKAAMVFHMLRREIGDQAFFRGIRTLVATGTGTYVQWSVLQRIFENISGQDLQWFFRQWVEEPGAPSLRITGQTVRQDPQSPEGFWVQVRVAQEGKPYRMRVLAAIDLPGKRVHQTSIELRGKAQTISIWVPERPTLLTLDPGFDVLRRLSRDQIPPMMNLWVTDSQRSLVLPKGGLGPGQASFEPVLHRVRSQGTSVVHRTDDSLNLGKESILVLGGPGMNRLANLTAEGCGEKVTLGEDHFSIQGKKYTGPDKAVLVTCHHPTHPGHVRTVFYGLSPSSVARVARLLFFYGWDSFLVFQNGKVIARGLFPPGKNSLEISLQAA